MDDFSSVLDFSLSLAAAGMASDGDEFDLWKLQKKKDRNPNRYRNGPDWTRTGNQWCVLLTRKQFREEKDKQYRFIYAYLFDPNYGSW